MIMADPVVTPPVPVAPQAWVTGLDADMLGHIQNRGWDKLDPQAAVVAAVKSQREAAALVGVAPELLIRMPKDAADETTKTAMWRRLGAPEKPEEYTFEGVDLGDPTKTTKLVDGLRATAASLNMPKDMVAELAKNVSKIVTDFDVTTTTERAGKIAEDKAKLVANWGAEDSTRFKTNMFLADQGAAKAGVTPEVFASMKEGMGGAAVAEFFRDLAIKMGEDKYVANPAPGGNGLMTTEQAASRKAELFADKEWTKKYYANSQGPEGKELRGLNAILSGS